MVEADLVRRYPDAKDGRRILVALTNRAKRLLDPSKTHMADLRAIRPSLLELLGRI
jgi:DNA-binding MarR family transcriptional regulator